MSARSPWPTRWTAPARRSDTTALVAVDPDGNACVCSHSLGLGSGVWLNGVHANSMLGEGELLRGVLRAGARMGSMMTPLVATDADGQLLLGAASAGGSRIRSALLQVLTAVLVEDAAVPDAVAAPDSRSAPAPSIWSRVSRRRRARRSSWPATR